MRTSTVITPGKGVNLTCKEQSNNDRNTFASGRQFDVKTLPDDLHRVYKHLQDSFGEQYALTVVFVIRTAIEMHRAWHMTLLTSKLLQQVKEVFKLRMTWNLGVTDLVFRLEDGLYELHRRIPYDYDSEFQDRYEKIAVALIEGNVGIHDALIIQTETKNGLHTSRNGLFLRSNPGRLVLYPFQAATVCVIFFNGDWNDCWVAAICGLSAGLIECFLTSKSVFTNVNETALLCDFCVGFSTGVIGGLFRRFYPYLDEDNEFCLSGIFLGTLYWFFYGTAFVIGLLEIIGGELNTGVVRFLSVSIKTFVLSVASAVGLTLVLQGEVYEIWSEQFNPDTQSCNNGLEVDTWWRIPFYILCSVSVLGQYRFILSHYWAGLIVQVVAYEVQYRIEDVQKDVHVDDGMETVEANLCGAAAAVATASLLCLIIEFVKNNSAIAILHHTEKEKLSFGGKCINSIYCYYSRIMTRLGSAPGLPFRVAAIREKLEDLSESQVLSQEEEATLLAGAVNSQEINVWSFLMPAVYQLVPGSKIALFWYNMIFPPKQLDSTVNEADASLYALMLISVSLALGLILGLAFVRLVGFVVFKVVMFCRKKDLDTESFREQMSRNTKKYSRKNIKLESTDDDPNDRDWKAEFQALWENKKDKTPTIPEENSEDVKTSAIEC